LRRACQRIAIVPYVLRQEHKFTLNQRPLVLPCRLTLFIMRSFLKVRRFAIYNSPWILYHPCFAHNTVFLDHLRMFSNNYRRFEASRAYNWVLPTQKLLQEQQQNIKQQRKTMQIIFSSLCSLPIIVRCSPVLLLSLARFEVALSQKCCPLPVHRRSSFQTSRFRQSVSAL
jgi:hypothetical protein